MDNENIKEILDRKQRSIEHNKAMGLTSIKIQDDEKLLDYITNLQDRIKELEQINEEHRKINGELREENKRLKEENKHIFANVNDDQLLRSNAMNYAELQDYKTRNEKVLKSLIRKQNGFGVITNVIDEINILQGKSDE